MVGRMKPTVWIGIAFAVIVIGAVAYSSFHGHSFRCRVCITFNGATDCRTASAATREEAQRSATTTACAQLAGGVSDSIRCENTPPQTLEWLH
jgi:hypothetical protein